MGKILVGDAIEKLKELKSGSVNMCVTSPPYWALRDYGVKGQLGLEPDFNDYVSNLCNVFNEVKRVLKDDGTLWVNIGDTYYGGGNNRGNSKTISKKQVSNKGAIGQVQMKWDNSYKSKCLVGIPFRFALEMINRGWILRNTIIWNKLNCMPSSVKDRFTVDFEYLFFFSKKKKYYFKQQLEPLSSSSLKDKRLDKVREEHVGKSKEGVYGCNATVIKSKGRNMRTVWRITTKGFKGAHFAVFPEELIETPIKAGCPIGGVVLDPFFGSGTTGLVALKQGKNFIGIELNPEYIGIAKKRIEKYEGIKRLDEFIK